MSTTLARIERRAWVLSAVFVAAALALGSVSRFGGPSVAAGVLGGATLSLGSAWAIRRGVGSLADAFAGDVPQRRTRGLMMLVGRYALLALIAYVMIARFRLSPLGLLLGASVIPAATAIEAITVLAKHGKV